LAEIAGRFVMDASLVWVHTLFVELCKSGIVSAVSFKALLECTVIHGTSYSEHGVA
jgi:hypothetical protein